MKRRDQYIDHPIQIPIELESLPPPSHTTTRTHGGIRCLWDEDVDVGRFVRISIPAVSPDAWADMQVSWQRQTTAGYELGLLFIDPQQAYRMRMMEQVCHITCYQKTVLLQEGRALNEEEAAHEWIHKHSKGFPVVAA